MAFCSNGTAAAGRAARTTARSWSCAPTCAGVRTGSKVACWNGEVVRLAFVIDVHEREVIAWRTVTGAGISGSDIRDLMLEAIETRFGRLPPKMFG